MAETIYYERQVGQLLVRATVDNIQPVAQKKYTLTPGGPTHLAPPMPTLRFHYHLTSQTERGEHFTHLDGYGRTYITKPGLEQTYSPVEEEFEWLCIKLELEQLADGRIPLPPLERFQRILAIWERDARNQEEADCAYDWAERILHTLQDLCEKEVGDGTSS